MGKMPMTRVRRLIYLLSRSNGLVLQILRQCSGGWEGSESQDVYPCLFYQCRSGWEFLA